MHSVRTRARYRGFLAIFVFLLLVGCPGRLSAQSKFAGRLPANTIAYWEWHGSAAVLPNVAKNHVLQLAFDPHLAPVWAGLGQKIDQSANTQERASRLGLEFADFVSLLSNPLVVGAVELHPQMTISSTGKLPPPQRLGVFLVYDATGKADLVQKLKVTNPQAGTWTGYDFHGTRIEWRSVDTKTGVNTTYRAQTGNYYVVADQKATIEDFIGRFGGNEQAASSLAERPEFQDARKYMDSSAAMDFFFRLPDFSQWMTSQGKPFGRTLAGLHLDKVHVGGGSVSFAGEATELRGAILGETSAGGPFDLVGDSRANFTTEPLAKMGPAFSASRVNLAAGYELLQGALLGTLTPQQGATVTMGQAMAQAFLGMPIDEALKLFTGEVAYVTNYSEDGAGQQVYAMSIQKPDAMLRILRAIGGKMIVAEDSAGSTTYLDMAYPYRDPVSGTQRRRFYYIAITPDMIFVAPRKAMLRQAQNLLGAPGGAPAGVLANPEVQQLRSKLPEKLTALSASDMTQIPWDKMAANLETQLEQGAKKQSGNTAAPTTAPPSWLRSIPPDVVSRHVHVSVGGSWKDANGFYFESYIQ